jgi:diaminopimelate decarboxylase
MPDPEVLPVLRGLADQLPTPSYVYFVDRMAGRVAQLKQAFGGRFEISYAAKANPNGAVLRALRAAGCALDVSSAAEIGRGLRAGFAASAISFSGPAKRDVELQRAIDLSCGHVVCESEGEIRRLQNLAHAANARVPVLLRINPARVPKKFGLHLGGRASQFGVDAEVAATAIDAIAKSPQLQLEGFHIHSGLNSLHEEGIAENFAIFAELFQQLASEHRLRPKS